MQVTIKANIYKHNVAAIPLLLLIFWEPANLINKLYLSIDTKYYNNDVHLSYKVMKILFELDRVMKNGLNL